MFPKIICIILVLNSFSTCSKATVIPKSNETNQPSTESNIKVLESDVRFLRADFQSLRTEVESSIQALRVDNQYLRDELEKQKKDRANIESEIKQLRAELEKQNIDGINRDLNIQQLKTELEQKKKCEVEKQSLQVEVDRLLHPPNCTEAKSNGINEILLPKFSNQSFKVACDVETRGGGWTIMLRRLDGSVNFYRNWTEYKNGFGNLDGEFFLGLDKIHALTADRRQELLVILEDFDADRRLESYDDFAIGDEDQQYVLHTLGTANGTAGDSLSYHRGKKFSTFDRDNDEWSDVNCAEKDTGAWWYGDCHFSNLAGKYNDNTYKKGVNWKHFRGVEYSLKTAVMMIRPRK